MGLFDTVKEKANALAADAERAGKVTAAQARTVVLQNDIRRAERELGHATFLLIEAGELTHPELEPTATRLRNARRALQEKEAEITALRGQTDTDAAPEAAAPLQAEAEVAAEAPAEATAVAVEARERRRWPRRPRPRAPPRQAPRPPRSPPPRRRRAQEGRRQEDDGQRQVSGAASTARERNHRGLSIVSCPGRLVA